MPTVMGRNDFQSVGLNQAAGVVESWETREQRMGFKMCKHSIAAMFIDKIKVIEPSSYPTAESREKFEDKQETKNALQNFDLLSFLAPQSGGTPCNSFWPQGAGRRKAAS